MPGARSSLNYGDHRESKIEGEEDKPIVDVRRTHYSRLDIAKIELDGFEVSFSMRRSVLVPTKDELGSEVPWVNVKFNEPLSFEDAFQLPFQIRTFFEISVGRPVAMKGMGVRAFRELPLSPGDERLDHFELYVAEDSEVVPATSPTHGDPIFKFWRSEDRSITISALEIWLSRRSVWASAYWLASQFILGGTRIDRSHMMRAMAWFESIPDYISEELVDEKAVKALCREARNLNTFKCMGLPDSRLKEVLNELARATLISRIEQAVIDLNDVAETELFSSAFLEDCRMAKKLRDKAAHGGDDVHEKDFRNVIRAATAIETLALLSTVRGLGLTREMMLRVTNQFAPHPFAGYFLWVEEAQ